MTEMDINQAIKIADDTITKEWKGMTSDQKRAFQMVINAVIDIPLCMSRGPRIGNDGCPYCKELKYHEGPHRPGADDGWIGVEW